MEGTPQSNGPAPHVQRDMGGAAWPALDAEIPAHVTPVRVTIEVEDDDEDDDDDTEVDDEGMDDGLVVEPPPRP